MGGRHMRGGNVTGTFQCGEGEIKPDEIGRKQRIERRIFRRPGFRGIGTFASIAIDSTVALWAALPSIDLAAVVCLHPPGGRSWFEKRLPRHFQKSPCCLWRVSGGRITGEPGRGFLWKTCQDPGSAKNARLRLTTSIARFTIFRDVGVGPSAGPGGRQKRHKNVSAIALIWRIPFWS